MSGAEGAEGAEELSAEGLRADHSALIHLAVDSICRREATNLESQPRAGEVGAVGAYEGILRKAVAAGDDEAAFKTRLAGAGVTGAQASAAAAAYSDRHQDLKKRMVEISTEMSGQYLADFDWKAQVTLASSKASLLRNPSVQLALYLGSAEGLRSEKLLELTPQQLDSLIASVSSAREAINRIP